MPRQKPITKAIDAIPFSAPPKSKPIHSARALFARSALVSFCMILPGLCVLGNYYRAHSKTFPVNRSGLSAKRPELLDYRHDAAGAKAAHQFWLHHKNGNDGVGVRVLEDPHLFSQLFPGYPVSLLENKDLWNRYFREGFNFNTRADDLLPESEQTVMMPWLGCLDIFAAAGADLAIFGSSEISEEIFPARFVRAAGETGKLLICSRSGQLPRNTVRTADAIRQVIDQGKQPRIRRILWGYSLWYGFPESPELRKAGSTLEQNEEWKIYERKRDYPGYSLLALTGPDLFPPLIWPAIQTLMYQEWRAAQKAANENIVGSSDNGFGTIDFSNLEQVKSIAQKSKPNYWLLRGQRESHCSDTARARAEFNAVVDSLLAIGDQVDIFLTPVTPLLVDYADPCLVKFAQALLPSRASDRVHVRFDDWRGYGLDWTDFVRPGNGSKTLQLDVNHPNYRGAQKVSEVLGNWLRTL